MYLNVPTKYLKLFVKGLETETIASIRGQVSDNRGSPVNLNHTEFLNSKVYRRYRTIWAN